MMRRSALKALPAAGQYSRWYFPEWRFVKGPMMQVPAVFLRKHSASSDLVTSGGIAKHGEREGAIPARSATTMNFLFRIILALFVCFSALAGETATLTGRVFDESGALVPGARVTITGPDRFSSALISGADGAYSITGVAPGQYAVIASAPGLGMQQPEPVTLSEPIRTLDLHLKIVATTAAVNVQENATAVSTDAASNASATVLTGDDLQSLSDDPQDLQADLEALAGPSAGPGGGSAIFIDGFSGGQLPAKESIREVRINQNPFSPEFDKLGLGRIEIFTKPGTDKYHGTVTYNLGTDWWNSRNPYAAQKAPFLLQETENSFSGPLSKHGSFTFDLERQAVDNGSVTNGVILDPASLAPTPFTSVLKTPQRHLRFGPHIDYQLNANNYLSLRYTLTRATLHDAGIGGFDLISRGYYRLNTFNTVQFIETSIHGTAVNETRFQYYRFGNAQTANTPAPVIQVLGAFNGGGASSLHSRDVQSSYELQNNTSIVHGAHFWRFGMRLRKQGDDSLYPQNFAGTFTFTGELAPALDANNQAVLSDGQPVLVQISSIEQYRRTVLGLPATLGGGASQFTLSTGTPAISVNQFDAGIFVGDDWRLRPNLTLNLGLRFETQTNIGDHADIAPRIGFAWAPGAAPRKTGKYVVRGGFGVFYDRFGLGNTLTAQRYNGIVQQQYVLTNPGFFPNVPSPAALGANPSTQSVWEVDSHLRSPYLLQSAMTLERQLPRNTTLALTYTNVHALHILRSADINAPIPGNGVSPYPGHGPIFLMTSSGLYNQNQFIANLNSKINAAVSVYATWVLNRSLSNSDGLNTFRGNPFTDAGEYGPASTDIRNRFTFGGTINTRWNVRLNPLVTYQSGAPFNITSGEDPFGTSIFSARPGIVTDASRPGVIRTPYGLLDPNPLPGETLIGRNAGRGPAQIMVNLRVQKTWSFGRERGASGATSERSSGGGGGGNNVGGLVPANPNPGLFSNSSVSRRYNLSLGMSGRNLLNRNNPGLISGNITSPLFGRANQIAGTPNGEGFLETASNRRLEMQVRFTF
jgi:hypothetical protein